MEDRDCRRSWAGEEGWLWRSKVMLDGCREWRGVLGEEGMIVGLLPGIGTGLGEEEEGGFVDGCESPVDVFLLSWGFDGQGCEMRLGGCRGITK